MKNLWNKIGVTNQAILSGLGLLILSATCVYILLYVLITFGVWAYGLLSFTILLTFFTILFRPMLKNLKMKLKEEK